jgi:hypothetical protein
MKARTPTLISIAILTALVIGAVFLQSKAQTTALSINVVFDPKSYAWDGTPPPTWNAEIWKQKVQDKADYSTIKLEGTYSPSATPYPALHGPRLIVTFSGADVKDALFMKLPSHMGVLTPGTYKVSLIVSGNLKAEFGGTPFEGDGLITVTVLPPQP